MARYKHYSYAQTKLIPVSFKEQILSGSFEHALNHEYLGSDHAK